MSCQPADGKCQKYCTHQVIFPLSWFLEPNDLPYSYAVEYTIYPDLSLQNAPHTALQPVAGLQFSLGTVAFSPRYFNHNNPFSETNIAGDEEFSLSDLPEIDTDLLNQYLNDMKGTVSC